MAPVVYTDDDNRMDQKELYFEASVLHRIPAELLVQSSSSTPYCQSFPNGKTLKTWLSTRKKYRSEERLRRIAKFHAELLGKSIDDESSSWSNSRRITNEQPNNKENDMDDTIRNDDMDRNELLLDINLKTMVLLHHNQDLQRKLNALARETRNLVRSCRNSNNTTSSRSENLSNESAN